MNLRISLYACAALLAAASPRAAVPIDSAADTTLRFDVFLDDRPIGYHSFQIDRTDATVRVDSEASFEVRFLFFTAFRYQHDNSELWRDGCLRQIDAQTLANGKTYKVSGKADAERFTVMTTDGKTALGECVRSFAYWDRALLDKPRLLNSQTGELLDIDLQKIEPGTVRIGDSEYPVTRYSLRAKDMDITLAYAADSGQWLGLDSIVKGERLLRYRRSGFAPGVTAATVKQ